MTRAATDRPATSTWRPPSGRPSTPAETPDPTKRARRWRNAHHLGADGRPDGHGRFRPAGCGVHRRQRHRRASAGGSARRWPPAVLIAVMRIARRRPVTQAIAGVFGVGIAAYIAYRTGLRQGLLPAGHLELPAVRRRAAAVDDRAVAAGRRHLGGHQRAGSALALRQASWSAATTGRRSSGCWSSPPATWCRTTCTTPIRSAGWRPSGC